MIIVAFYDATTGAILQCTAAPREWIEADRRPWIELPEYRIDWDATHHVVDGTVQPVA